MKKTTKEGKTNKRILAVIVALSLMMTIIPMNLWSKASAAGSYSIDKFGTVPDGITIDLKDGDTATIDISLAEAYSHSEIARAQFSTKNGTIATVDKTDEIYENSTVTITALAIGSTNVIVNLWYCGADFPEERTIPVTVKRTIDYSVEYYYDNTIDPGLTLSLSAELGSTITDYVAQPKNEFKFEKTEGLPLVLDASKIGQQNTIKVFYIADNDPEGITIDDVTKIYGDGTFTIPAVFSPDTVPVDKRGLTWDSENAQVAEVVAATGVFTIKGVGTSEITVETENGLTDTCTLTVNKMPITVTADDKTRKYGETNPAFTFSYGSFAYGETSAVIDTLPSVSCTAAQTSNAGNYDITLSGGSDNNYTLNLTKGSLAITKTDASLILTAAPEAGAVYGSTVTLNATVTRADRIEIPALAPTGEVEFFVDGVSKGKSTLNANGIATKQIIMDGVGDHSFRAEYTGSINYFESSHEIERYSIGKADQTIRGENEVKTYGNTAFDLAITDGAGIGALTFSGYDNSLIGIDSTGEVTIKGTGMTTVTVTKAADDNYNQAVATFTVTVNKAILTVTADNKTRKYGETNPAFTLSYGSFAYGEISAVIDTLPSVSCAAVQTSNTGIYDITLSGGSDNNYILNLTKGSLAITKADASLILTATPATGAVHGAAITLTATVTRADGIELPALVPTGEVEFFIDGVSKGKSTLNANGIATKQIIMDGVGDHSFRAEYTGSINYFESSHEIERYSIGKADQTIRGENEVRTYGDAAFDLAITDGAGTGALTFNGYDSSLIGIDDTGKVTVKGTGTTTVTVTKVSDDNYNQAATTLTVTVNKALLSVTADDQERKEGEDNPSFTVKYSGFMYGESEDVLDVKPRASCNADKNSTAGSYDIIVSGGEAKNYMFVYEPGKLTVKADEPKEPTPSSKSSPPASSSTPSSSTSSNPINDNPKTGAATNFPAIIALMVAGLGGLWIFRKRKVSE